MYLSFSGFKWLDSCLFAYWNRYINKTQLDIPDDRLGSIFGSAIGYVFEEFYVKKLWKAEHPRTETFALVEPMVDKAIAEETTDTKFRKGGVLLWKGEGEGKNPRGMYANREEIIADVRDAVERGFRIIRHHRLLGPRADAEVKLDFKLDGHKLGGRCDLLIERTKPHRDLCILDGKGSRHRDKYVDRRQLFWYAMLYQLNVGQLPDKLGFLFWRYDPPVGVEEDDSIDWTNFSQADIDELREQVMDSIKKVEKLTDALGGTSDFEKARKVFLPIAEKPKPDPQKCRFCEYGIDEICPKGAALKQKKFRK